MAPPRPAVPTTYEYGGQHRPGNRPPHLRGRGCHTEIRRSYGDEEVGAGVHPEDPRVGQWVPGDGLHDDAGKSEGGADQDGQQGARKAQGVDDHVSSGVAGVGQRLPGLGPGDASGSDEHAEDGQADEKHEADEEHGAVPRATHRQRLERAAVLVDGLPQTLSTHRCPVTARYRSPYLGVATLTTRRRLRTPGHRWIGSSRHDLPHTTASRARRGRITLQQVHALHSAGRGVAQLGSALALGARGHRFKSGHPDQMDGADQDVG